MIELSNKENLIAQYTLSCLEFYCISSNVNGYSSFKKDKCQKIPIDLILIIQRRKDGDKSSDFYRFDNIKYLEMPKERKIIDYSKLEDMIKQDIVLIKKQLFTFFNPS